MNESIEDLLAVLAVGGAEIEEAAALAAKLAVHDELRDAYLQYERAAEYLAQSAQAQPADLTHGDKRRMLARILSEAASQGLHRPSSYAKLVPHHRLTPFGPGIEWAVLPGEGMTTVFWIFTPPQCGDAPLETHVHEQSGYVLDGACTLLHPGGKDRALLAGDRFTIPSGALHGMTFQRRTILCDVYVPKKIDFERMYAERITDSGASGI